MWKLGTSVAGVVPLTSDIKIAVLDVCLSASLLIGFSLKTPVESPHRRTWGKNHILTSNASIRVNLSGTQSPYWANISCKYTILLLYTTFWHKHITGFGSLGCYTPVSKAMNKNIEFCINVLAQWCPIFPLNYPLLNSVYESKGSWDRKSKLAFLNFMLIAASLKSFGDVLLTQQLKAIEWRMSFTYFDVSWICSQKIFYPFRTIVFPFTQPCSDLLVLTK